MAVVDAASPVPLPSAPAAGPAATIAAAGVAVAAPVQLHHQQQHGGSGAGGTAKGGGARSRQGSPPSGGAAAAVGQQKPKGAWSQVVRGEIPSEAQQQGGNAVVGGGEVNPLGHVAVNSELPGTKGSGSRQGQQQPALSTHVDQFLTSPKKGGPSSAAVVGTSKKKEKEEHTSAGKVEKLNAADKPFEAVASLPKGELGHNSVVVPSTTHDDGSGAGTGAAVAAEDVKPAKPAWKKPSINVGKAPTTGPVMGAVSWPALGDARRSKASSEPSPKSAAPASPSENILPQQVRTVHFASQTHHPANSTDCAGVCVYGHAYLPSWLLVPSGADEFTFLLMWICALCFGITSFIVLTRLW